MAELGRDAAFVDEAAALRPRLQRCARALYPGVDSDFSRADRAVDQALARVYALGPEVDHTIAAFRALLHPTWGANRTRRPAGERVELRDIAPIESGDLAEDLAALGPTSQAVVVLSLVGGLGPNELSRILAAPKPRIVELFTDAVRRLARPDPARRDLSELARQLGRLVGSPDPDVTARAGVGDLARGRRLEQRVRRRRGVLAAAVVVLIGLIGGFALLGGGQGETAGVPPPTPPAMPTPSYVSDPWRSSRCDVSDPSCRAQALMRWQFRVSGALVENLDTEHQYFSAINWQVHPTVESESFWRGEGGALALGLSRFTDGGTEVYLQIATDMEFADPCGRRIRRRCSIIETMDGNVYAVAGTSTSDGGVEVQYVPDEDTVITVVARNISAGKKLDISSGDLISLAGDDRLRLPRR